MQFFVNQRFEDFWQLCREDAAKQKNAQSWQVPKLCVFLCKVSEPFVIGTLLFRRKYHLYLLPVICFTLSFFSCMS